MKIIFFGTPEFVIPIPQALLEAGFNLVAVVTNPDRVVGKRQILTPSPTKQWAQKQQIPILTPEKLDSQFLNILISQYPNIDLGVLAAYGKILPPEILRLPKSGCLCIHPSLLPKYRGASPVQAAIINGERETGVSIIKMDEKMDHGPIVSQFKEEIKPDDTAESLYSRLFQAAAEVLVTILPAWVEGRIIPREQDHSQATYTKLLKKEDGFIPAETLGIIAPKPGSTSKCKLGPDELERFIRAMSPWPGAWTEIQKTEDRRQKTVRRLKILKAHIEDKHLVLDLVQLEGKKPVTWKQFREGYPGVKIGTSL
ncbi:MAG: methionyl-tRNA formyltransferase [Patescibacteria group bacterium]